jgi:hypothetical protein
MMLSLLNKLTLKGEVEQRIEVTNQKGATIRGKLIDMVESRPTLDFGIVKKDIKKCEVKLTQLTRGRRLWFGKPSFAISINDLQNFMDDLHEEILEMATDLEDIDYDLNEAHWPAGTTGISCWWSGCTWLQYGQGQDEFDCDRHPFDHVELRSTTDHCLRCREDRRDGEEDRNDSGDRRKLLLSTRIH